MASGPIRPSGDRIDLLQVNRPTSMPPDQAIERLVADMNRVLVVMSNTLTDLKTRVAKLEKSTKS